MKNVITFPSPITTTLVFDNSILEAAIGASMRDESNTPEVIEYNAAVDAIESMLLAQAHAGVDVMADEYREALVVAVESVLNRFDGATADEPLADQVDLDDEAYVTVIEERRVNAIVNETREYNVTVDDWTAAYAEHGDESDALDCLRNNEKADRISSEYSMVDINAVLEFSVSVEE